MQPLQPVSGSDLQRFLSAPEELLQESVALQLAILVSTRHREVF
ncbi:hypothetical protein [Nostoc sp. NMS4]|nr:hypothetical protein [Nostoc sp. NMS4]